jgi:NAD(P)H dehydrogenase (quinone)
MKHAVVVAHPKPHSLTVAAAEAYAEAARGLGHEVLVRDLYQMGFDPCLKAAEMPAATGAEFAADVVAERQLLADVDVFCLVYPLWFNAPPAILKGYLDRVFSLGFGFGPAIGGTEPLLDGRRLISFTFSGAPEQWVRETGAFQALTTLLDRHLAGVCGLRIVDHVHAGGIVQDMPAEAVDEVLEAVRAAVRRSFGDPVI